MSWHIHIHILATSVVKCFIIITSTVHLISLPAKTNTLLIMYVERDV